MVNLHLHTNFSDGVDLPDVVLKKLKDENIEFYSITDHDNVDAYKFISDKDIISGVELSSDYSGGTCHILGYGIDLTIIDNYCKNIRQKRIEKSKKMLEILKELGYEVDIKTKKKIIGKRDICNSLVNKYFDSYEDAKNALFIKGKPCYIELKYPMIHECINIIHEANGIAVLAHPWTLNLDISELDEFLKKYEFDGVEVYNHNIDCTLCESLKELAQKNNLYQTCGTDYHGYEGFNEIKVSESVDCKKIIKHLKGI